MDQPNMAVAQMVPATEAEGPGRRFALWFQGCPLRCPGCCNPEFLPFRGGTPMPVAELVAQLQAQVRLTPDELKKKISAGEIWDGMTLAAWSVARHAIGD